MKENRIIAIMSDWGNDDGAVGSVKGVILNINPEAKILDMSHNVESFDVKQGAFLLMAHYQTYPKRTIFVVVIDPGVGTKRQAILVQTPDHYFIGPDNGVLTWALHRVPVEKIKIINITNDEYFRKPVSSAFHGRDIFAPVAAHLSKGVPIIEFGEEIKYRHVDPIHFFPDIVDVDYPLEKEGNMLTGEVLFIDKFGNLITSIIREAFNRFLNAKKFELRIGGVVIKKISNTYEDGKEEGEPLAIFGGDFGDCLDIALYQQDASKILGVKVGDKVIVKRK